MSKPPKPAFYKPVDHVVYDVILDALDIPDHDKPHYDNQQAIADLIRKKLCKSPTV